MSNGIVKRQNEDKSIAMLAAQRQLYRNIKKFDTISIVLSVWIPFILSIVRLLLPEGTIWNDVWCYLSIISMILSFIVYKYIRNKKKLAALIQQKFDVYVYTMPWNDRIFGKDKNINHEIATYSNKILNNPNEKNKLYNWYTPVVDERSLIDGILLCQRENLGWDVGLRKRFKCVSIILIVILIVVVYGMGLCKNESVRIFSHRLAFVAPMIVWILTTVNQLDEDINALKELDEKVNNTEKKTMDDLQYIQKDIYEHRKECYAIPDCIYNLFKDNDEDRAHREAMM